MPTVPQPKNAAIEWFIQRTDDWIEHAIAIGLSPQQAQRVQSLAQTARTKRTEAKLAMAAARDATLLQDTAIDELREIGGKAMVTIRAFAEQQQDPAAVYALSSVPPVAKHGSLPPEVPHGISFELLTSGSLSITWKGKSNSGTTLFTIARTIESVATDSSACAGDPPAATGFNHTLGIVGLVGLVGLVGVRSFVDSTIPPGTVSATYVITAHKGRYDPVGSTPVVVNFSSLALASSAKKTTNATKKTAQPIAA